MSAQKDVGPDVPEESEGDSIENYLAKLQSSIGNIIAEGSGDASSQDSQVTDVEAPKERRKEKKKRRRKPVSRVVKEEKDELKVESEETNPLYAAQTRLARLERWNSLALKNGRTTLRQRLLRKAILDQKRKIERIEKGNKTVERRKTQHRREVLAYKTGKNVGRIIKPTEK